jgi:hypothetical protein
VWWHGSAIAVFRRLRQKDDKSLKASLGYMRIPGQPGPHRPPAPPKQKEYINKMNDK